MPLTDAFVLQSKQFNPLFWLYTQALYFAKHNHIYQYSAPSFWSYRSDIYFSAKRLNLIL